MSIQKKISARKLKAKVGKRLTAMLEGPSSESELVWEGRLEGMAPEIDGKIYVTDLGEFGEAPQPGDLVTVEITKAHDYDLVARVVDYIEQPRAAEAPVAHVPVARVATGAALRVLS